MFQKSDSQKKKDLELLKNFRKEVIDWRNGHGDRSAINQMMVRVRKLLAITGATRYLTLNAPPMMGGQRILTNENVLDLLFQAPFDVDVTGDVIDSVDGAIGVLSDSSFEYPEEGKNQVAMNTESKKVFIVHGHDTNVRNEVELFIRSIGYDPIILCKRADKGNTIIEKIEREAKDVCFAIVIYTSCDLGKDRNSNELRPRARQNVVFEHGFMCAHLGRERVCALLEEGIEQPGDLQGVIYKQLDSAGAWKYQIADEMKAAGLNVDKNRI